MVWDRSPREASRSDQAGASQLNSHRLDDEETQPAPQRVWFGKGGRSPRRRGASSYDSETESFRESQLVHSGSRKRASSSSAATNSAVAAGLALAAVYWGIRGALHLFHSARRSMLRAMLLELAPALDACPGLTYWLDFGTLLGIFRDGDIIRHDNDIDVAVLNPCWDTLLPYLQDRLQPKGYYVKAVHPSEDPDTTFLRVYCPLGMADVFGAHTDSRHQRQQQRQRQACSVSEEGSVSDGDCISEEGSVSDDGSVSEEGSLSDGSGEMLSVQLGHGTCCDIPADLVLPTGRLEFRGVDMAVPGNIEGALVHRYGDSWAVPKYMDKGSDTVEQEKLYARLFSSLSKVGIRI